jgi:ubiquitin-protein ligase
MMATSNKRQVRLGQEWERLQEVNRDSDYVRVEVLDVLPGRAPEKYKVTFKCRGITGVEAYKQPIYGKQHEVQIYCHADFPTDVPWLQWLTPIWHPNIEHSGQKRVCVNKAEWLGGMALVDLCQQMFEMVQYKNYHAELTPPYPLDGDAATWVREYGEPKGIVDKKRGIFVDSLPFYKAGSTERVSRIQIVRVNPQDAGGKRIKFHSSESTFVPEGRPARGRAEGVSKETVSESVSCPGCGTNLPPDSKFCGRCGSTVESASRRVRFGD